MSNLRILRRPGQPNRFGFACHHPGYRNWRRICKYADANQRRGGHPTQMAMSVNIDNARDLSSVCPSIKPGLLIRSACPFQIDAASINELGLRHMIDLRNPEEYEERKTFVESGWQSVVKDELVFDRLSGWHCISSDKMKKNTSVDSSTKKVADTTETHLQRVMLHRVSILDRDRFQKELLFNSMDLITVIKVIWGKVFDTDLMYKTIIEHINTGGLELLYKAMLESSKPEFCAALDVVLQAAETGESCLYFCKVGKDRTGLLSAMLLSIAGADDDTIIADYAESDQHGDMAFGNMERKELQGLDRSVFKRAPAAAMKCTLAYCSSSYGSLSNYMTACGFSLEKQHRLRCALLSASAIDK